MTVLFIVVSLAAGAFFASMLSAAIEEKDDGGGIILCLMLTVVFLGLGAFVAHNHGTGELSTYNLEPNAIYETLSSAPTDNGKYAAILQDQAGDLSACLLATDPPKVFKVTGIDNDVYQPFPATSPAPSVLPTK